MKQDFCVVGPGGRMVARGELQVEGSRASAHIRFDPIAPRDAWAIDLDASAQARRDVVLTRIRKQTSRVLRMRMLKRFFRNSLAVALVLAGTWGAVAAVFAALGWAFGFLL